MLFGHAKFYTVHLKHPVEAHFIFLNCFDLINIPCAICFEIFIPIVFYCHRFWYLILCHMKCVCKGPFHVK